MSINANLALINGGLSTKAIVRTRFPLARMPDIALNRVMVGQGAGISPVEEEVLYSKDWFIIHDFTDFIETGIVGSGNTAREFRHLKVSTGGQADSQAVARVQIWTEITGDLPGLDSNYDKPYEIEFFMGMEDDRIDSKSWLDLALTTVDPNNKAIGFRIDNLAAKGIVHNGTALTVVDLGTTLAVNSVYRLKVIHTPGDKVEWFINGVSKGSRQTYPRALY